MNKPKEKRSLRFISTILLVLSMPFTSYAQPVNKDIVVDKILVKVNDEIVLKSELDLALYQSSKEPSLFNQEDLECKILESLIINKMLVAQAEIDSVTVDEKMVDDQLNRRMQYFAMQFGSEQKIEEVYGKSIQELKKELRPQVREQMIMQRMQEQIMNNVKVTPSEVRKFYKQIPKDSLPYFSTEVEVGQIVKFPSVNRGQKQKTIDFLLSLKKKIEEGANFGELAKVHSQDPGTAGEGGELGFFKKGELVPEYEAAAMKLQPNELSDPVESEFGFHLIQMIERKGNEYNTRHILIKPSADGGDDQETIDELNSIRKRILADSISFQRAAKTLSEDKNSASAGGMFIEPTTASTKIAMDKVEPEVFFLIDTMDVGSISKPVPYTAANGKKGFRIIYFKSKSTPHYANLEDDYTKISEAALNDKKATALEKWFERTVKNLYISVDSEYQECDILN